MSELKTTAPAPKGGDYKGTKPFAPNPPATVSSHIQDHSVAANLDTLKDEETGTGYTPCGC